MKITKPRIGWKILKKGMKSQYNDFHWKKNKDLAESAAESAAKKKLHKKLLIIIRAKK